MTTVTDENRRAQAMAEFALSDWDGDGRFDHVVEFVAELCEAPVALVSLVEVEQQRFLGRHGLDASSTPRSTSFCAHAMQESDIMIVSDARIDPRFSTNPLVTGAPHIRFYAGAPLVTSDGLMLGALCVIDHEPRDGLTDLQKKGLNALAREVVATIESRRTADQRLLITQELNHRVKNLFAVMGGLVHFAKGDDPNSLRGDLIERIGALSSAHELILPDATKGDKAPVQLLDLCRTVTRSYAGDRMKIVGDPVMVPAEAVTPMALILHELLTNATKYGALSNGNGQVTITLSSDDAHRLDWREDGGPAPTGDCRRIGFGSSLIETAAARQLVATIERNWLEQGLHFSLSWPKG